MATASPRNWIFSAARILAATLLLGISGILQAASLTHHQLQVTLLPEQRSIQATDQITLADTPGLRRFTFLLHADLQPQVLEPGATLRKQSVRMVERTAVPTTAWEVTLAPGSRKFTLRYQGRIYHPIKSGADYTSSLGQSPGIIATEGALLSATSYWYPQGLDDALLSFSLEVQAPTGWKTISQGELKDATWQSSQPQREIYLIAGPFSAYQRSTPQGQAMAFLRQADQVLATRYLDATAHYLDLYSRLIAPYPYPKFAMVENFWETGYGMPSFTLLGSKVIRLPFLLESSYPHEILHNWWGNSVFVDYQRGNWCEGLTAYLADHLIQEQQGRGAEFRRAALQKYADYARAGNDFPLTEFRSRHGASTEAVGYGKTLMFFHMLRRQFGDEKFIAALRRFYQDNRFRSAAFSDLQKAFEAVTEQSLEPEFDQWLRRSGAPQLRISEAKIQAGGDGFVLSAQLQQTQSGPAYRLQVPVTVTLAGQAWQRTVSMDSKQMRFSLTLPAPPLRIDIDPEFDLFRRLDPSEIPPSLSQLFGAEQALILLPSAASPEMLQAWRQLAESWRQAAPNALKVRLDSELDSLPKDRSVWIFGWDNRFRDVLAKSLSRHHATLDAQQLRIGEQPFARDQQSLALSTQHPDNAAFTLGWVAANSPAVIPVLGRKITHYGRYGYLAFSGEAVNNIAKAAWPTTGSALSIQLTDQDSALAVLPERKALIE